jgi:hypothetical protein
MPVSAPVTGAMTGVKSSANRLGRPWEETGSFVIPPGDGVECNDMTCVEVVELRERGERQLVVFGDTHSDCSVEVQDPVMLPGILDCGEQSDNVLLVFCQFFGPMWEHIEDGSFCDSESN